MNYDLFVKNEKRGASSLRYAKRGRVGGDPNNHIFIGTTDEDIKKTETSDGTKHTDGATYYKVYESNENHFPKGMNVQLKALNITFRKFDNINIDDLIGKVSFVMLHKTGLFSEKISSATHELGAHIFYRDKYNPESNADEDHKFWKEDWLVGDGPANSVRKELRQLDLNNLPKSLSIIPFEVTKSSSNIKISILVKPDTGCGGNDSGNSNDSGNDKAPSQAPKGNQCPRF